MKTNPASGFRNLPIELFSGPNGRVVFDAKRVAFIEVEEPLFSVLGLLRDEDLDPREFAKRLNRHPEPAVRKAYRQFRKLQKDGYLVPGPFRRAPKYDRSTIETMLTRKLGGFTVMVTTHLLDEADPCDRVALLVPNVPEFSIAYFGILYAGASVVPINVLAAAPEVTYPASAPVTRAITAPAAACSSAMSTHRCVAWRIASATSGRMMPPLRRVAVPTALMMGVTLSLA